MSLWFPISLVTDYFVSFSLKPDDVHVSANVLKNIGVYDLLVLRTPV